MPQGRLWEPAAVETLNINMSAMTPGDGSPLVSHA